MNKYAQLKRFHHENWLQVYMHAFMNFHPEKMPVEKNLLQKKCLLQTTRKCQLQDQSQNIGLDLVACIHNIMS